MKQILVRLKVVEMLVDPMLENVQDSKLNRLTVLLSESLHILSNSHFGAFVADLRI